MTRFYSSINNIVNKIRNFTAGKKKVTMTVIIILTVFFITALIIFTAKTCSIVGKTAAYTTLPLQPLEADQPVLLPPEPLQMETYPLTRVPKETWTSKDKREWFTQPDEKSVERLKKTNDSIISDITGAAP